MAARPTILVTGATGAQGGSVARHLLAGGKHAVRCVTRKPTSDKARALTAAGAQVVQGDLDDPPSLVRAASGCQAVFGVTNFWEHLDEEREVRQGRAIVDAAAAASVEHLVLSTLPYVKKLTKGEIAVPHFDGKGRFEEYARGTRVPSTFLHVAFYYENFLSFFPPRKQADGRFVFGFPQGDTPLAAVSAEDVGGVVAGVLAQRGKYVGKTVGAVGDDLPVARYAETLSRVLGRTVVYEHVPRDAFARLGFPGADDLAQMFDYNRRFIPDRKADVAESRALYPKMRTFEAWLKSHREAFAGMA